MNIYQVSEGWVTYVQVGSITESRYSDDPYVWDCVTIEEARSIYDGIDLRSRYIGEKMTAGKCWRERDAYKTIEVQKMMAGVEEVDSIDECEWLEYVETVAFEKWGLDERTAEESQQ